MSRSRPAKPWPRAPIVVSAWLTIAGDAHAIDGVRPRTPVLWPDDAPCLLEVDRTTNPVVNLPYAIPFEDPPAGESITEDEVSDGRRHQFFAFANDIDPRIAMPAWISWDDIMRAAMLGLVDPATVEPEWVLDGHPLLGDSFVRIEADDARRPITFTAAAMGVDWDTTAITAGSYVVRAYTWDPWPNMWAYPRHGVVRIHDALDDPTLVPALAVDIDDVDLYRDQIGMISGCLAAPPGTTLSAAWADFTDPAGELTTFAEAIVADDGVIAIEFPPPEPLWGGFAVVRVTAIDPAGLRYDAFVPERITILASAMPGDCEDDCGSSSESGTATTSSGDGDASTTDIDPTGAPATATAGATTGDGTAPEATPTQSGDCACTQTSPGTTPLALLALALRRRRRQS